MLLRSKIFETYGRRIEGTRRFKEKKTHSLVDRRVSDLSIGIDERDLLIVSAAYAQDFVLATLDGRKEMKAILQAAKELETESRLPKLDVEYWDLD